MAQTTDGAANVRSDVSTTRTHPSHTNENTGTDYAQQRAQQTAQSAKSEAERQAEELKQQARQATEAARQKATEAAEKAKQSGTQYAREKKARVAEEIGVFSGAIRKASDKLHEEQHDSIASYVDAAAEQLDQVRSSLESKDVGELVNDLQDFTRRRPEVVYGGLFVAGLAAMRFLKASQPRRSAQTRAPSYSGPSYSGPSGSRPPEAFGHDSQAGTPQPPIGYRNQGSLNPKGGPQS